ncbi:MAG: arginine--tRNA ligase [Clostridia bacterium]|nr:arginine--tRNA ligase [Clostridia bacterium]
MEELKKIVASSIGIALSNEMDCNEILDKIEVPKDKINGDFAYPCFHLAKIMRNSPANIASELKEKITLANNIKRVEAVNGYLNFYMDNANLTSETLAKIMNEKEMYGSSDIGNGQNIVIDYSSPNIAKPFHLGHFRNTVLGSAMYRLYQELGYHMIGINYLGDWGRQFGLLIEGYNRYKEEYDIEKDPLNALSDIYVRINTLAKEDETVMDAAREQFKRLEQGDTELLKKWEYFREISLKEYNRIYEILGCHFDSYNGEAFYNDKMEEVIDILIKKNVLIDSQGAKVVEVGNNMPPCIVLKSNGSTIYATRDLAAILYRARTYDFTKAIYVTGSEQILHFRQVFEVAKNLVDEKYQKGLVHIPYGMIRLKTGKMSTREGNIVYINDLINDAIYKSKAIIVQKNAQIENVEKLAKQVGVGALVFNYLKSNKLKDIIFDLDETLRFDGETGPYVQYTYVRIRSLLEKANFDENNKEIKFEQLANEAEINLIKELAQFETIILKAANEYEPSILTRYIIDIATLFSRFYNECQVLNCEDENLKLARCALSYCTGIVIKKGLAILGIECPDRM